MHLYIRILSVNQPHLQVDLTAASVISVKIYDVTGSLVQTLVNEKRPAGIQQFTIQISRKGVYFAHIQANATNQVIKIVNR